MAGLTTMSGNQALSSAGMIYFNAAEGYNIEIKKQIEVLLPTKTYNRDMQVFRGDTVNGKIDWRSPEALPHDSLTDKIDAGKALFVRNCRSCHKINETFTGPALNGITERKNWNWIYALTVHDMRILDGGCLEGGTDKYWDNITDTGHIKYWRTDRNKNDDNEMPEAVKACLYHKCLNKKYGNGEMASFPSLSENDAKHIYAYVKSESDKRPELKGKFKNDCCDSCVNYIQANIGLLQQREQLKNESGQFFNLERIITIPTQAITIFEQDSTSTLPPPLYTKITPTQIKATYYTINIKTTGWYNIDILMKEYAGCVESELFVRLKGNYNIDVNINLIIPSYKVFVEGGKLKDSTQYGFDENDGKIKLPQNTRAYIIAFAEKDDKLISAKKEFNTQTKQTIELSFTEISKQQLKTEITSLKLDNVQADIEDSKNAKEIKTIERELKKAEHLKPKNCDCDYLISAQPVTADSAKK